MTYGRTTVQDTTELDAHHAATDGAGHAGGPAREMLSEHIPLSLIMDMASPDGPHSAELLESEGLPDDEWWTQD